MVSYIGQIQSSHSVQSGFHDHGIGKFLAGLEVAVVVAGIPARVGDVVEVIPYDHTRSRIATVFSVRLDYFEFRYRLQRRAEFATNHTLRGSAARCADQLAVSEAETIHAVQ